jgi:hypothetical protein
MIESLARELLSSLFAISIDKWKGDARFRALRLLAHEQVSRELRWNIECLSSSKSKDRLVYLKALRTDVFTGLSDIGAPIDDIFTENIEHLALEGYRPSSRVLKSLAKDNSLSRLLDRTYNRIGILRLRVSEDLPYGDISYLRGLIKYSLAGVDCGRRALR